MKSGWSSMQSGSTGFFESVAPSVRRWGRRLFENCIASTRSQSILFNPSYKGLTVDALALGAEEGRGRLR